MPAMQQPKARQTFRPLPGRIPLTGWRLLQRSPPGDLEGAVPRRSRCARVLPPNTRAAPGIVGRRRAPSFPVPISITASSPLTEDEHQALLGNRGETAIALSQRTFTVRTFRVSCSGPLSTGPEAAAFGRGACPPAASRGVVDSKKHLKERK